MDIYKHCSKYSILREDFLEEVSDKLAVEETAENTENSELIDEFCRNTEYLDGENSSENKDKIKFSFNSIYAEEDIKEALEEIFSDRETVKSAMLLSWVRREQRSNVHDCVLVLEVAAPNKFVWPFFLCLFKVPLAALITYIIKKDWHCPTNLKATTDTFVCGDQRSTTATRPGQATTSSPGQTTAL